MSVKFATARAIYDLLGKATASGHPVEFEEQALGTKITYTKGLTTDEVVTIYVDENCKEIDARVIKRHEREELYAALDAVLEEHPSWRLGYSIFYVLAHAENISTITDKELLTRLKSVAPKGDDA